MLLGYILFILVILLGILTTYLLIGGLFMRIRKTKPKREYQKFVRESRKPVAGSKLWEIKELNSLTTTVPRHAIKCVENTFTAYYDTNAKIVYYVCELGMIPSRQQMYSRTKEHWRDNDILPRFYFPYNPIIKQGVTDEQIRTTDDVDEITDWYLQYGWKVYLVV